MNFEQARFNMVEQQIRPWEVLDFGVLDVLMSVRREEFVPEAYKSLALSEAQIPLGHGASMLVPVIEGKVLQAVQVKRTDKVLEIGAGSGFMAALLAAKAEFVYTVEIDPELVELARKNLAQAGVANVSVDLGDAAQGWPLYKPYDVIVVSGSLPVLPDALLRQLKIGGRLVAIVGEAPVMEMLLVTRTEEDAFNTVAVLETVVAPLENTAQRDKFVF